MGRKNEKTTKQRVPQVLGIKTFDRAKKVLKSARPLRIIHRVKVRIGGGVSHPFFWNKLTQKAQQSLS